MLIELSKLVKNSKDMDRLADVLNQHIMIDDNFTNETEPKFDQFYFGLFHAYHESIYRFLKHYKIPAMSEHHVTKIGWVLNWLETNEEFICLKLKEYTLTYEEININQTKLEFSEN